VVRDAAILSAIGVDPEGRRRVLGVSAALSEAEVHWRSFLDDLVGRGLRGVRFITSDDHAGLRAARQAVFPGAQWQRCQFHLAQNAIHHAPNAAIRKAIGAELRRVWNASTLVSAQEELDRLVKNYQSTAPKLATWLESAVPEGLAVFSLPDQHRRRLRTANPIERAIQQEIKRRTSKVRVFPNKASLLSPPSSSKSTRTGQPPTASTSTCSTKMTEAPKSKFPEIRLLNQKIILDLQLADLAVEFADLDFADLVVPIAAVLEHAGRALEQRLLPGVDLAGVDTILAGQFANRP
jgi:transposase-like protein